MTLSACCVIHDIGFYHHARMQAAAAGGPCSVVEIHGRSAYPEFKYNPGAEAKYAVVPMAGSIVAALEKLRPGVVFLPGWADRTALAGLRWCLRTGTPAVVFSESTKADATPDERRPGRGGRAWWREATKRRIVPQFSAALVGGAPHREYAVELGMAPERVFDGYDVVDNEYFAAGADAAKADAANLRAKLGLPERYFFGSARFIPKKNLPRLIRAFAAYRAAAGPGAWDLILLGDGPEKPEMLRLVEQLKLGGVVHLPGFKPVGDLPAYYGLAGALVHASTTEQWGLVVNEAMAAGLPVIVSHTCGCAPDLVTDGETGFAVDPRDEAALAKALLTTAAPGFDRAAMGRAARARVAEWGPARFGTNFWRAAESAVRAGPRSRPIVSRVLLSVLGR
jgi:glycosyltransferase involved in cell wall biosynthesis